MESGRQIPFTFRTEGEKIVISIDLFELPSEMKGQVSVNEQEKKVLQSERKELFP